MFGFLNIRRDFALAQSVRNTSQVGNRIHFNTFSFNLCRPSYLLFIIGKNKDLLCPKTHSKFLYYKHSSLYYIYIYEMTIEENIYNLIYLERNSFSFKILILYQLYTQHIYTVFYVHLLTTFYMQINRSTSTHCQLVRNEEKKKNVLAFTINFYLYLV